MKILPIYKESRDRESSQIDENIFFNEGLAPPNSAYVSNSAYI